MTITNLRRMDACRTSGAGDYIMPTTTFHDLLPHDPALIMRRLLAICHRDLHAAHLLLQLAALEAKFSDDLTQPLFFYRDAATLGETTGLSQHHLRQALKAIPSTLVRVKHSATQAQKGHHHRFFCVDMIAFLAVVRDEPKIKITAILTPAIPTTPEPPTLRVVTALDSFPAALEWWGKDQQAVLELIPRCVTDSGVARRLRRDFLNLGWKAPGIQETVGRYIVALYEKRDSV